MRWKGRQGSSNVEDRRGGGGFRGARGGARTGGSIGIGGIVVVLLISWVTGINPLELLGGMEGGSPQVEQRQSTGQNTGQRPAGEDELARFTSVVLADTETTWNKLMQAEGRDYPEPRLVLFSDYVPSACGQASSASGPFYCGADEKIYIDLSFYRQLSRELGAPGDFAQAYVLAHEVGHHVQNVLGILPEYQRLRRTMSTAEANALSVRVELQADCLAGVWAHHAARQQGFVEDGDVEEALNAASRIGDDTLQRQAQGYVVPESFNHGTSAQRVRWFREGFRSGDMGSCDTFNARSL